MMPADEQQHYLLPDGRVVSGYYPVRTLTYSGPPQMAYYPQLSQEPQVYQVQVVPPEYAAGARMKQAVMPMAVQADPYSMVYPAYQKGMYVTAPVAQKLVKPPVKNSAQTKDLYKTELCRSWSTTGTCGYGDKCLFAHGNQEMRSAPKPEKYKTTLCRHYHATGQCPYGPKCRFIHGAEDITMGQMQPRIQSQDDDGDVEEMIEQDERVPIAIQQQQAPMMNISSSTSSATSPPPQGKDNVRVTVVTPPPQSNQQTLAPSVGLKGSRSRSVENMVTINLNPGSPARIGSGKSDGDRDRDDKYLPASAFILLAKSRSHPVLDFNHPVMTSNNMQRRSEPQSPPNYVEMMTGPNNNPNSNANVSRTPGSERRSIAGPLGHGRNLVDLNEWKESITAELAHLEV